MSLAIMGHYISRPLPGWILAMCLLVSMPLAHAGFGPAASARDWCKKKTLHYLEKRGYIPYNWEATTYLEDDNYVSQGVWRIDVDNIKVQCITKKHARKSSGRYKILNVDIFENINAAKH